MNRYYVTSNHAFCQKAFLFVAFTKNRAFLLGGVNTTYRNLHYRSLLITSSQLRLFSEVLCSAVLTEMNPLPCKGQHNKWKQSNARCGILAFAKFLSFAPSRILLTFV